MHYLRHVAGAVLVASLGCASPPPALYDPESLRQELYRRLPDVPRDEVVVPFEVDPAAVERARAVIRPTEPMQAQVQELVDLLSDDEGFGLTYLWAINNSAARALADGGGNCMGLSSLLVGLARSLGLRAYYVDVSFDPEHRQEEYVRVSAGHVAVVVFGDASPIVVDFTGELRRGYRHRRIGDLEATAHYYNNLGYERIHRAQKAGTEVDWAAVRREFARATRVAPGLARAWNNLGVASARLGDVGQAERSYRRALQLDPELESTASNLMGLLQSTGEAGGELQLTPSELPAAPTRAVSARGLRESTHVAPGDVIEVTPGSPPRGQSAGESPSVEER